MIDAAMFDTAMFDTDAECGDSSIDCWYGLLRAPLVSEDTRELTAYEREYLRKQAGCIITEDTQGFVFVEYFFTERSLDAAWAECLRAVGEADEYFEAEEEGE